MDLYISVNATDISLIDSNQCFFDKCVMSILDLHVLFFILDWPCYKNLPKQFSTENCRKKSAHKVAKTKRFKATFKASFKDFKIPTEFWEQATQDRTKWR